MNRKRQSFFLLFLNPSQIFKTTRIVYLFFIYPTMRKIYFLAVAAIAVNMMCVTTVVAQSDDKVLNLSGKLTTPETSWSGDKSGTPSEGMYGTDYANTFGDDFFVFSNTYTESDYGDSWSGFAYTNTTDITTAGYTNMSAITGAGYNDGIDNIYTIASLGAPATITFAEGAMFKNVSMYITNATYAYLSMKEGDDWAKKFGGNDGTDADSLILIATVYDAAKQVTGESRFTLADFRFENSGDDYIVKEWKKFDLSSLGAISSISFSMESSDNSTFGMNTPAYFCLDGLRGAIDGVANEEIENVSEGNIYYAGGSLYINGLANAQIQVVSMAGISTSFAISSDSEAISYALPKGVYVVRAIKESKAFTYKINVQ